MIKSPEFMQYGACGLNTAELFFDEKFTEIAKAICNKECNVRLECLDYGLAVGQSGVFGGLDEADRVRL